MVLAVEFLVHVFDNFDRFTDWTVSLYGHGGNIHSWVQINIPWLILVFSPVDVHRENLGPQTHFIRGYFNELTTVRWRKAKQDAIQFICDFSFLWHFQIRDVTVRMNSCSTHFQVCQG